MNSFDIRNTTRGPVPRVAFASIAERILGSSYSLSLVLCGDTLAQRLNTAYRKKTYKPNVLSFPLSRTEGEIFLNLRCAEREARKYGVAVNKRIAFLFIHACLHLKGLDHSARMDGLEQRHLKAAGF
jgi:rRNA maturation RNase YbeY